MERDSIIDSEKEYDNLNADFQEDKKPDEIEKVLNQTFIIEESFDLDNPSNETVIDEIQATITSPPVDAAVIKTVSVQEPSQEEAELEISETATAQTTESETSFKTTLIQEVPTTTPKYNFTHNNNSGTENLDRKILAFELDFHNKKILAERLKQSSIPVPKTDISLEEVDAGLLKAQEDENKQFVPSESDLPQNTPPENLKQRDVGTEQLAPQENSTPEPRRTLLDSSVTKRRHIISNYVQPRNQVSKVED